MVKKNNQPFYLIDEHGTKFWYFNNQLHRDDNPAVEYPNGDKTWYLYGKLHRLNGPAIEWANIAKAWWYHGKRISCSSQEEFEKLIKLKWLW